MKKLAALILTFVFLFSLAACNKNITETPVTSTAFETSASTVCESSENTSESSFVSVSLTTEKHSEAVTEKNTTTVVQSAKTTLQKITTLISTTAAKKTKPSTTRRKRTTRKTTFAVSTTVTTAEESTATATESTTKETTEPETEEKKPVDRPVYVPIETTTSAKKYCTISISCSEILKNENKLKSGKKAFVPSGGEILKTVTVEFEEGETVFDILCRVCESEKCADGCEYCQSGGIQLEYEYTPGYENYYIEGIHQIYEKDCGSKSGWMYKVNGTFPNYGCSDYKLKDGDKIEFVYTCDLGEDVGAEF